MKKKMKKRLTRHRNNNNNNESLFLAMTMPKTRDDGGGVGNDVTLRCVEKGVTWVSVG